MPAFEAVTAPAGVGADQALLERPDGGAVGNLAAVAQADKALEAEAVEQLELHLLVAQVNSCWITSSRTISSVGNGGRPPHSRPGRGAA